MVMVAESSGPSVESNDQLQVPSWLSITSPVEALSVIGSTPGSAYVPVLAAGSPSSTVTVASSAAPVGVTLATATVWVGVLLLALSESLKLIVTDGVAGPSGKKMGKAPPRARV